MKLPRQLIWFWLSVLFIKICICCAMPLFHDETYYWVWSNHLQLSYFDHPGMASWLFWLGHVLSGFGSAVKIPAVLLGHCTLLVWLFILHRNLTDRKLLIFAILYSLMPMTGLGSIIATPDLPLMFFWSLCILIFLKFCEYPSAFLAAALGICLGLGFNSKYQIVLIVPCFLWYLCAQKKFALIKWSHALLTVLCGLLFCLPVLYWNFKNDFVSFRFQLNHGLGSNRWFYYFPLEYLAGQILLVFPTVFIPAMLLLRNRLYNRKARELLPFAVFPLLFFLYSSFRSHVEMNWPIMIHPAFLSIFVLTSEDLKKARWPAAFWSFVLAIALFGVFVPGNLLQSVLPKLAEASEFKNLLPEISKHTPLYARSFQMASQLSFQSQTPVFKLKGMNRLDIYDYLPESQPDTNKFFLAVERAEILPPNLRQTGLFIVQRYSVDEKFDVIEVEQK